MSGDAESERLCVRDGREDAVAERMESVQAAVGSGGWREEHSALTNVLASLVMHVSEGRISQTT